MAKGLLAVNFDRLCRDRAKARERGKTKISRAGTAERSRCIGRMPDSEKSRRIFERALRRKEEEEIYENKNHRNGKLSAGDSGDK